MARCMRMPRSSNRSARQALPDSTLTGIANLLIFPNIDSANIAFNLVKASGEGVTVGPMLLGLGQAPAYRGAECHRTRDREHLRSGGDGSGPRAREEVRQAKSQRKEAVLF